jgi:hypothetical protein
MTAIPMTATPPTRLWADAPALMRLAAVILMALAPLAAAMAIDTRTIEGLSIWLKPVKFHLALVIYLVTLAFFARYARPGFVQGRAYRAFQAVAILAILGELAWIGGAAALGTTSHFNISTPVWSALYALMGIAATLLTMLSTVFGLAILRNPGTGLPPALRHGIGWGLVLTLPLTLITAGTMSGMGGHFIGPTFPQDTLPLMGWSLTAGDLRVSHFFATHSLHAIPLMAWAAHHLLPVRALPLTWVAALLWCAFTLATFAQALAGQPFLPV